MIVTEYTTADIDALPVQIPRRAWTGGSAPPPYRDTHRRVRGLIRESFREAMRESVAYWGDGGALAGSTLQNARIQWARAKADTHASIRAAVGAARGDVWT